MTHYRVRLDRDGEGEDALAAWATRAAAWYVAEFARRTDALAAGEQNIDWADPEFRVTWSEVNHHHPHPAGNPVDARLAFDAALKNLTPKEPRP